MFHEDVSLSLCLPLSLFSYNFFCLLSLYSAPFSLSSSLFLLPLFPSFLSLTHSPPLFLFVNFFPFEFGFHFSPHPTNPFKRFAFPFHLIPVDIFHSHFSPHSPILKCITERNCISSFEVNRMGSLQSPPL